jgi:hypothetical protein
MYSPNLIEKLNVIANEYRDKIFREITEVLKQPKYFNTGAGLESLRVEVIPGTKDKSPDIIIKMDDHVNIINKRKMEWTGQPPVDLFEAWAQTKDFNGPIPGYKNGLAPNLPPWKAKQRIVWAIVKSKQKFDTWKAKPWRKKALSTVLKELNQLVLLEFDKAIEEDFQLAINKGMNG